MAIPSPAPPLRACLLSGGDSRRMGRDKALLPHPAGGCWLEQSLRQLAALDLPITVFSRHASHLALTERLALQQASGLAEPPPWNGPLVALQRLMALYPEQRLLLCPVDMPALTTGVLQQLLAAAAREPTRIHLAHDGERLQPLLGVYPSDAGHRTSAAAAISGGERTLQRWLSSQDIRVVQLEAAALRNVNHPDPHWGG